MPGPHVEVTGAGPDSGWAAPSSGDCMGRAVLTYLSSLTLRRGRRANHQMLAIVARTPRAAAGLAILRERSDMQVTLPGPPDNGAIRRCGGILTFFFRSSSRSPTPSLSSPYGRPAAWGTCQEAHSAPVAPSASVAAPTAPR